MYDAKESTECELESDCVLHEGASVRIEVTALRLGMKIRGQPKQKGELIQFVRERARHSKQHKLKQIECYGDSYVRNYSRMG